MSTSPLSLSKKIGVVCVSMICGMAAGYEFMSLTHHPARHIASLGLGKHLAPVRVEIVPPEVLPDHDEQEVEISGYVTLSQEVQGDVRYQWILPEGVSLVEGQTSDEWSGVHAGQTAVTKISVTGFSKDEKRILTLEASTQIGANRMGNTAIISSRPEDSMEFIAPAKMKARQAFDQGNRLDQ